MAMRHERGECQVRCATWQQKYELAELGEYRTFPRRGHLIAAAAWGVA